MESVSQLSSNSKVSKLETFKSEATDWIRSHKQKKREKKHSVMVPNWFCNSITQG